ncbi:metallo-beta-lactamase class B [Novosphingobium kunmingense]|uniref:Metallo-beta-lactamase class B n=1 Tax=Novosphingobium kunmingense TaxID=1211806 RepID=A0A2N0I3I7_9SPHN|nr:subclass B3 metallo-beta-lactamase [Novosphingobium kunmingense]PKB25752.1 metallo-beta-lactamase class B [Novosphingobium kunmingense]
MSAKPPLAALALLAAACAPIGGPIAGEPSASLPAPGATDRYTTAALASACQGKDGWTDPAPPAHVFGNTWYVGTCGITALLVTSPRGHVLVDAGMPAAAPLVAANVEKLGFAVSDIRWIVGGHEHFDHAGGIAELKRRSGAKVAALASWAQVMASGQPDPGDPQHDQLLREPLPPVAVDRVLADRDTVALGPIVLSAHATPAHSPGSTSWTWQSCEGAECRTITYADSTSTISADGYRFSRHPDRVAAIRTGLARVAALPCGVLVTPHPSASDLMGRMATGLKEDPRACAAYAAAAASRFATRLAADQALDAAEDAAR